MWRVKSIEYVRDILKPDSQRKTAPLVWKDLLFWILRNNGGIYYFYLLRLHCSGNNLQDYLSVRQYVRTVKKLKDHYYRPLLEDKILFDRYVTGFGLPAPPMIGIAERGKFYDVRRNTWETLEKFCEQPVHAFCKLNTAFGGREVHRLDITPNGMFINHKKANPQMLKERLSKGKYLIQKTVRQHSRLDELNPSCVNTLRIYTTFTGEKGRYFSNFLRMGVGESVVDNVSSNNIVTGVLETGRLMAEAHSWGHPPRWYTHHPDTGTKFSGFVLPFYEEAKTLCEESHRFFPEFFMIAWDVAIQESGPVIIEANPAPDLTLVQVLHGGKKKEFGIAVKKFLRLE